MKEQLEKINASPTKRIYLSIIADYNLEKAICELIDNAIDSWKLLGRINSLKIDIELDSDRQIITVTDNAGGVRRDDILKLVSPGESTIEEGDESIGIFGVGSKRAVVYLSQNIKYLY